MTVEAPFYDRAHRLEKFFQCSYLCPFPVS